MSINEEVVLVKKELFDLIIEKLQQKDISSQDAQGLAREFLSILPITDQKDLLAKLKTLSEDYNETSGIYLSELQKYSDQERDNTLSQIRTHINQGDIEKAISAAKSIPQT